MRKLGSSIRRGEESPDPDWEARRRSMTRIERGGYVVLAAFFLALGFVVLDASWTRTNDGESDKTIYVFGIACLIGCGYLVRKAWLGKRKLPEER